MSVLGAFHVNTASTASGSGLTSCLSTILPRYLIESLRISHFDGLHFKPALFMHPKTFCVASFVLRLPYGERRSLQLRFRVRRNYSNQYPPYVLKIHLRSDLGGPAIFRNLPHLFSLLIVLSLAKPVCQILVYMTRGVTENSSSLISHRPFRFSLKTIYE